MRVLFVCSGNNPYKDTDGVVPFIYYQAQSLIDKKIDVDFFRIKGKGLKAYIRNALQLRQYIKKNPFNIVHAHFGFSGWVSVLSFTKIKKVVSFMGEDIYGRTPINQKNKIINIFIKFSSFVLQFLIDFIIVKSPNLTSFFIRRKKIRIIPNGVNLELFCSIDKTRAQDILHLSPEKKNILFLGYVKDPRKNFKLLENAIADIQEEIKLITPFPSKRDSIPIYLNACDAIVLTSKNEGSPNIIKEAMACNCPIVATDVGDIKWILGNTEGTYVTDFDHVDLSNKLKACLKFSREKKRTNGRNRIIELELDTASVADRIICIYNYLSDPKAGLKSIPKT